MRLSSALTGSIILAALALPAAAQPTLHISPQHRYAWGENTGFLNFSDADSTIGGVGVRVQGSFLSGDIWSENLGWISVGNGAGPYLNIDGANSGVNYNAATNLLSGYAWSENAGWINFGGGALASPANPARVELSGAGNRLRGYAWGENIGWINLDDTSHYIAVTCPADIDGDGQVDLSDFFAFFNCWDVGGPCAEIDGVPDQNLGDFFAFFDSFDAAC